MFKFIYQVKYPCICFVFRVFPAIGTPSCGSLTFNVSASEILNLFDLYFKHRETIDESNTAFICCSGANNLDFFTDECFYR